MSNKYPLTLMYHGIVGPQDSLPEGREVGAEIYDVTVADFTDQMNCLAHNSIKAVLFSGDGRSPAEDSVVLTFDDGEMNNFYNAYPVLKQHGFKAYFFVTAKRVGRPGYMGWKELKKLHDEGMVIGSHGLTHEVLTNLLTTQIGEELGASKKFLERNLGVEIDSLSIPRGFCNDRIVQMAYDAGYRYVFASQNSEVTRHDCVRRVAVRGAWTLDRFEKALAGHIPDKEKVFRFFVRTAKFILRERGYNFLRSLIIKIGGGK